MVDYLVTCKDTPKTSETLFRDVGGTPFSWNAPPAGERDSFFETPIIEVSTPTILLETAQAKVTISF